MRINISIVMPWVHGKPLKTWLWHTYLRRGREYMVNVCGVNLHYTNVATWSGIGFSLNLWRT